MQHSQTSVLFQRPSFNNFCKLLLRVGSRTVKRVSVFKKTNFLWYSETLNNQYIERIYQMSYSSIYDIGMLQISRFLIK